MTMADDTAPPPTTPTAAGTAPAGAAPATKFEIPETVRAQYPDLVPLILETESMNDDERRYWFQILPIMTPEQVLKLRDILANEKKQLFQETLDQYQQLIEGDDSLLIDPYTKAQLLFQELQEANDLIEIKEIYCRPT